MVIFTFIRHGQSTDNVKRLWAGWKDAPLSNHATALGTWFTQKGIHFAAILSSPLNRAATTAEMVLEHQPDPCTHIKSLLLREQHFGIAEGKPWKKQKDPNLTLEEHYARGIRVIDELLLPYVLSADGDDQGPIHIAVVSHGIFIREIVDALYRRELGRERMLDNHRGLNNTGWTRVVVKLKVSLP
ncbi:phosphoglycerate mutase-like protein, partial [Gymnopus androsaceus JB14]